MPRPKVLPANRARVDEACFTCRKSHKRCTGSFPCAPCIKNKRAETCRPCRPSDRLPTPRRSQGNQVGSSSATATESSAARSTSPGSNNPLATRPDRHVTPQEQTEAVAAPGSPEAPHRTHPRMLRNLQGERGRLVST